MRGSHAPSCGPEPVPAMAGRQPSLRRSADRAVAGAADASRSAEAVAPVPTGEWEYGFNQAARRRPVGGGAEQGAVDDELGSAPARWAIPRPARERSSDPGHRAGRDRTGGRAVSARGPGASVNLAAAADIEDLPERERRLALFTEFVLDASVRPLHSLLTELADSPWAWRHPGPNVLPRPPRKQAGARHGPRRRLVRTRRRPQGPRRTGRRVHAPVAAAHQESQAQASQDRKKTSLKTKYLFGYDAHLIVTRDTAHDAVLLDDGTPNPEVLPALVLGVSLDKPGHRPAYNGLKILNRGRPP